MKTIKWAIVCFVAVVVNFQLCHAAPVLDTEQDRDLPISSSVMFERRDVMEVAQKIRQQLEQAREQAMEAVQQILQYAQQQQQQQG